MKDLVTICEGQERKRPRMLTELVPEGDPIQEEKDYMELLRSVTLGTMRRKKT